jgi:hypothetical protein
MEQFHFLHLFIYSEIFLVHLTVELVRVWSTGAASKWGGKILTVFLNCTFLFYALLLVLVSAL